MWIRSNWLDEYGTRHEFYNGTTSLSKFEYGDNNYYYDFIKFKSNFNKNSNYWLMPNSEKRKDKFSRLFIYYRPTHTSFENRQPLQYFNFFESSEQGVTNFMQHYTVSDLNNLEIIDLINKYYSNDSMSKPLLLFRGGINEGSLKRGNNQALVIILIIDVILLIVPLFIALMWKLIKHKTNN